MNLLSVLQYYDTREVRKLRLDFQGQLAKKIKEEKEYCQKNHEEPKMTTDKMQDIDIMLEKCGTAFHIEALKRFVFFEMIVPDMLMVEEKAHDLMTEAFHV